MAKSNAQRQSEWRARQQAKLEALTTKPEPKYGVNGALLFTEETVANLLGCQVRTVRRAVKEGHLSCEKADGVIMFSARGVMIWQLRKGLSYEQLMERGLR